MKNYIGIDLGTTNSAITSFDGETTRVWKSPEQTDVTPSVIFFDRRGNKYVGKRAYDSVPHSPENAAKEFKRFMGSSTPISLRGAGLTMTPEECSAEILRVLFGYLPEEMRKETAGSVITVPAAFDQMQKDATLQAAEIAGIGRIAVMQEPVAAVMSVMRARKADGVFLVFDMGGGTLDVAVAESVAGRVSLLSHGGIAMCGGRDFDVLLAKEVVRPWLMSTFDLPDDVLGNPNFTALARLSTWAAERAKIELSAREDAVISLSEAEARSRDRSGKEVYLDIPLKREAFSQLIAPLVRSAVGATREALSKAGMGPKDVERIVFVGGPTQYKPLRDLVTSELGIPGSTEVNPMTAVAEGAAVFAESIDWSTASRGRKQNRGSVSAGGPIPISFAYTARTPDTRAKIAAKVGGSLLPGVEFQVDSLDTGWSSGRLPLKDGVTVEVALPKAGENSFKVFVFDGSGAPLPLEQSRIGITRAAATVDAIPASYSVGIEVLEKIGGRPTLEWLVRAGEPLPKKGKKVFKAAESLRAGTAGALNFNLWEGEIDDPISDNRYIGSLKINGTDIDDGAVAAGAELIVEYEVADSGNVTLEVQVPSIGGAFHSGRNFYARVDGQLDYTAAAEQVVEASEQALSQLDAIASKVDSPKLEEARSRLESASELSPQENNPESAKRAMDGVLEAKKILAQVRKEHLPEIRQLEFDKFLDFFNESIRSLLRPTEVSVFENLIRTVQRAIDRKDREFENLFGELRGRVFEVLFRQDWFVVDRFQSMAKSPHHFADRRRFQDLVRSGMQAMASDDIDRLRQVVVELSRMRIDSGSDDDIFVQTNIVRS